MAGEGNKNAAYAEVSPKRSTLEADDGCQFFPGAVGGHLMKKNLFGSGGMDVCDSPLVFDSGVSMTSLGYDGMSNPDVLDNVKPKFSDLKSSTTCVSAGYSSIGVNEDPVSLEGQMEGLSLTCCEAVTTPISSTSTQTAACPKEEAETVPFIDRIHVNFTPDDDGDT